MIDVVTQVSSVARRMSSKVVEAGEARTVTISQTYRTTVEDLWDACTNIERIPRWFLPITGDLRLGGHYQLEGHAGGTIERYDPPRSFGATWEYGGNVSWIEAVGAWMVTEEARSFMTASSDRWCDAAIAAGTPAAEARAQADRATAAYTGAEVGEDTPS